MTVPSLGSLLVRLWYHLSSRRRRQFISLFVLMIVSAGAEVVSLGAILPFLGVLTNPEHAFANPWGRRLASWLGVDTPGELILPLTVVFIVAVLLAGAVRLLLLWLSTRLAYASGADLSADVYRRTLYQPYRVHVARNSSQLISGITNKVAGTVNVLYQLQTLGTSLVFLVAITIALLLIDTRISSIALGGFGVSYGVITWLTRKRLLRNGARVSYEQTQVIKSLQEGLGGIRDVLLDGTQPLHCSVYRAADLPLRHALGNNAFIAGSPRFVMEALGMVLIAGLAYFLSFQPGGLASSLPVLGALALGAQRLLPALQQSFSAWASIAGSQAALLDTLELLDQPMDPDALALAPAPLRVRDAIRFESVSFRYASDAPWVLKDLNLTIPKGARIAFVGRTGSGKSTASDLLMGLLSPTAGRLLVDDMPISGPRVRAWQRTVAHVPQHIYLADASIEQNIAFGIAPADIDPARVRHAARQAQISDFIEGRPDGYQAFVGERGVRLSGGQRQRIGIARALYKQADLLVLDEATSALDNETEQSVMESIERLDRDLTVVLIAHRLSTVRRCDTIIELEDGQVVAQGPYDYVVEHSPTFRAMTALGG